MNWRAYQDNEQARILAKRPRHNNTELYIMWLLIVIIAVLLYSFTPAGAPPPAIVPRLICIRCHCPPAIRTVGQYRRIKQNKKRTADDMRAVRELQEQEYIMEQLLASGGAK